MLGHERSLTDSELLETVSRLYGLRGGLSIISQEKQKVDKLDEEYRKCEESLILKESFISSLERELFDRKKVGKKVGSIIVIILFSILATLSFIGLSHSCQWFYYCWILNGEVEHLGHILLGLISPILILFTLAIGLASLIKVGLEIKKLIYSSIRVKKIPKILEDKEVELPPLKEEMEKVAKEKAEIVQNCKTVYQALIVEYQDLLDARDWKMLDLLIFYFETGRACSRAEALQLADRQVSENEMKEALHQVEQTINNSTDMIVRMMIECTGAICNRIAETKMEISRGLTELTSVQNAQLSTQKQANTSSIKMMENITRILEDKERRELNHIN